MLNAGFSTLDYLKRQIFPDVMEDDVEWDEDLKRIGLAVAVQFDRFCNRGFARMVDAVHDEKANHTSIVLHRYPVEVVTSVEVEHQNYDSDFTNCIVSTGKKSGVVEFDRLLGSYRDRLTVIYTGGYWLDDGSEMPAEATALPADVLNAFVLQVQAVVKATDVLRNVSVKAEDDTMEIAALRMLQVVEQVLNPYRRYA